jgi:hypothetical protein
MLTIAAAVARRPAAVAMPLTCDRAMLAIGRCAC